MAADPRKTVARLGEAAQASPFDAKAAKLLLASLSARLPVATHARPIGAITVTRTQALAYRAQPAAGRVRSRRPRYRVMAWAAVATGVIIGVLTGLSVLQTTNSRRAMTASVQYDAPALMTSAPSAFVAQPAPLEPVTTPEPTEELAPRQAPVVAASARAPRASRPPKVIASREAITPSRELPPAQAPFIDRAAPQPLELAVATPPPASPTTRPRALVVVRQSSGDVLGVPRRAPGGARVEGSDASDLRSVDAERMAAAVDARQAVRLP